jgi:hypothetical protein
MRVKLLLAVSAAFSIGGLSAQPARAEDPPITKRDLLASSNNIKQILLATINMADSNQGKLPSDIVDKSGKPLLSWRVAILPYLEEGELYKQFKMDEPWDSDNNKKLIEKMPKLYAPVRVKAKAGETYYQVFSEVIFSTKRKMLYPASITDGTSLTGLVFEAGESLVWSKPADLPFDIKKKLPKLGGMFDGDFHVGMCDGSVMLLRKNADEEQLKFLITPNGGEVIDLKKLQK